MLRKVKLCTALILVVVIRIILTALLAMSGLVRVAAVRLNKVLKGLMLWLIDSHAA